jgi:hypothetical protein
MKKSAISKHIILAIAIAFIFVFFASYAIQSFYPAPEYDEYCEDKPTAIIQDRATCESEDGTWNSYDSPKGDLDGYCDFYSKCQEEYEAVRDPYERNVFIVNVIIGILVLVLSFLLSVEAVSSGFMFGGVIMLIYGTTRYWGNLSNVLRTIVLGLALGILVWVGYKKLK